MIKVIYHRKYHRVTVEGHARSGEPGHDLVCAAASALAYTLGGNVYNMDNACQVRERVTLYSSGHAEISCNPLSKYNSTVTMIFDSVCVGFEMLAANYPEYISYKIRQ